MIKPLLALLRRARPPKPGCEDPLPFQRLHQRLVRALAERDPDTLAHLLADDVKLHLRRSVRQGRLEVLFHLDDWLGVGRIHSEPPQLRRLDADLVALDAEWVFDCPERGNFVERYTCLWFHSRGLWKAVQLRQCPEASS